MTAASIDGLPNPGILVADRWGKIVHVAPAPPRRTSTLTGELISRLEFVPARCPGCEGEVR